jgi:hypothetical protein
MLLLCSYKLLQNTQGGFICNRQTKETNTVVDLQASSAGAHLAPPMSGSTISSKRAPIFVHICHVGDEFTPFCSPGNMDIVECRALGPRGTVAHGLLSEEAILPLQRHQLAFQRLDGFPVLAAVAPAIVQLCLHTLPEL